MAALQAGPEIVLCATGRKRAGSRLSSTGRTLVLLCCAGMLLVAAAWLMLELEETADAEAIPMCDSRAAPHPAFIPTSRCRCRCRYRLAAHSPAPQPLLSCRPPFDSILQALVSQVREAMGATAAMAGAPTVSWAALHARVLRSQPGAAAALLGRAGVS
jgi:hypothetical protein